MDEKLKFALEQLGWLYDDYEIKYCLSAEDNIIKRETIENAITQIQDNNKWYTLVCRWQHSCSVYFVARIRTLLDMNLLGHHILHEAEPKGRIKETPYGLLCENVQLIRVAAELIHFIRRYRKFDIEKIQLAKMPEIMDSINRDKIVPLNYEGYHEFLEKEIKNLNLDLTCPDHVKLLQTLYYYSNNDPKLKAYSCFLSAELQKSQIKIDDLPFEAQLCFWKFSCKNGTCSSINCTVCRNIKCQIRSDMLFAKNSLILRNILTEAKMYNDYGMEYLINSLMQGREFCLDFPKDENVLYVFIPEYFYHLLDPELLEFCRLNLHHRDYQFFSNCDYELCENELWDIEAIKVIDKKVPICDVKVSILDLCAWQLKTCPFEIRGDFTCMFYAILLFRNPCVVVNKLLISLSIVAGKQKNIDDTNIKIALRRTPSCGIDYYDRSDCTYDEFDNIESWEKDRQSIVTLEQKRMNEIRGLKIKLLDVMLKTQRLKYILNWNFLNKEEQIDSILKNKLIVRKREAETIKPNGVLFDGPLLLDPSKYYVAQTFLSSMLNVLFIVRNEIPRQPFQIYKHLKYAFLSVEDIISTIESFGQEFVFKDEECLRQYFCGKIIEQDILTNSQIYSDFPENFTSQVAIKELLDCSTIKLNDSDKSAILKEECRLLMAVVQQLPTNEIIRVASYAAQSDFYSISSEFRKAFPYEEIHEIDHAIYNKNTKISRLQQPDTYLNMFCKVKTEFYSPLVNEILKQLTIDENIKVTKEQYEKDLKMAEFNKTVLLELICRFVEELEIV